MYSHAVRFADLSPWEFVQWIKPVRLRAPSKDYNWSVWTPEGKKKLAARKKDASITFEPFVDYVLNEKVVNDCSFLFPFLPADRMFSGAVPKRYVELRHSWLLMRRQRPVIPCPEQCPLPSRRMSKDRRAKILSVYLRPWTLASKLACRSVPLLKKLCNTGADAENDAPNTNCRVRIEVRLDVMMY